jgi:AraC-like DNA-binding protein
MSETLRGVAGERLERSCGRPSDWIRVGSAAAGVERAEARFSARAFAPHRHDTYAIGITLEGVQTFRYRGSRRTCLPGELHLLHPDETHDGAAGTDAGFRYRIVYIEPELIRGALDGEPLPFVADPVHVVDRHTRPLARLLVDIDEPIDDLARVDIATTTADALHALGNQASAPGPIDVRAVELAREHLAADPTRPTPAAALERITGLDRYTVARHFRRAFGTSPDRYRTMRRLALARAAIEQGTPLARVAADTGFADQSHLTRQFKRAFGITPRGWARAVAAGSNARVGS